MSRRDALPEFVQWKDSGCHLHSHCLTCPLAVCVLDRPHGQMDINVENRLQRILALRDEGLKPAGIAIRLNISESTVFRMLRRTSR